MALWPGQSVWVLPSGCQVSLPPAWNRPGGETLTVLLNVEGSGRITRVLWAQVSLDTTGGRVMVTMPRWRAVAFLKCLGR
jgi:hypothetical protein